MRGGCRRARHPRLPGAAAVAALVLAGALGLSACGGDDSPEETGAASEATTGTVTETVAEPPPEAPPGETGGGAGATTGGEAAESRLADEAATGPQSCEDVVITPNSGNGLFAVEAQGITCEDARAALEAWGESGFPGESPPGFSCQEVAANANGSARLRCEQEASGAVVEFDTGG